MQIFHVEQLAKEQARGDSPYLEFWRAAALSVGRYVLPAGGHDPQQPHGEDEVYYVVRGRGRIQVGEETRPVEPGSIVYVPAGAAHRFVDIAQTLHAVVFFAPAESG